MALLPDSPAIDAGDDTVLGSPFSLTTDQRGTGFPRKSGLHVDIGALEVQQVVVPSFDTCLRDDSNGNLLKWNRTTGAYRFTTLTGFTLTGTALVTIKGSFMTLKQFGPDRRLLARIDNSTNRGAAAIQFFPLGVTFTITDRTTLDDACF
jgi:hypothetical protein